MNISLDLNQLINQGLATYTFKFENNQPPKPLLSADNKINSIKNSTFKKLQEKKKNSSAQLCSTRKRKLRKLMASKKGLSRFDSKKNVTTGKRKSRNRRVISDDGETVTVNPAASLRKIHKKHLDALGVTTSPLKNLKKVPYLEHPMARRAAEYKKKINATAGRNVSIVLYRSPNTKTPRHTIAITEGPPGGPHAELRAFDMLPEAVRQDAANLVFAVYTEREPCTAHDSGCARKLKSVLAKTTEIYFSANHDSNPRRQLFTELEFQRLQAQDGIRLSSLYEKNVAAAEELAREQDLEFNSAYYRSVL